MISNRVKRVGLVALVVVLIALIWMMNRERGVDRAPAEAVETPNTRSEHVVVDLTSNQPDAPKPIVNEPLQTSTTREATPTPEPPIDRTSQEKPAFSGTFVLERLDGTIDLHADGSFGLVLWQGDYGPQREVSVVDGVWRVKSHELHGTAAKEVFVACAKVGQRSVSVVSPKDEHAPIDPLAIEVRVRAVPDTQLHVVDATTRAELSGVEIRLLSSFQAEVLGGDALHTSPIDLVSLGLGMGMQFLEVRAPWYAHGRIDVVCGDGTERILALVLGGDLRVSIERDVTTTGFHLALTRLDQPLEEALRTKSSIEERTILFDGLEPGDYVVTAFVGAAWRDPILLGETRATVRVGDVAQSRLVVAPPPTVHRVDARGLLLVPLAWSVDAPEASVRLLSASAEEQQTLDVEFTRAAPEGDLDAFS